MIGLFSYLPTAAFMPVWIYFLAVGVALFRSYNNIGSGKSLKEVLTFTRIEWGLMLVALLAVLNFIFGLAFQRISFESFPFPYLMLVPLIVFIAKQWNLIDSKVFLVLVAVECLIACIQWLLGVKTFFTFQEGYTEVKDATLLYFRRPFGLSSNSSALALKALIGILLIDFDKVFSGVLKRALKLLFIAGLVLTFGRTVLIVYLAYELLKIIKGLNLEIAAYKRFSLIFLVLSASFVALIYLPEIAERFARQFTRDIGSIELTGREKIWEGYFNKFIDSPLYGNHSVKLMFGEYHAHNSFLQLLADNGVVVSLVYLLVIALAVMGNHWAILLAILLYSTSQYGIFWGISVLDIFFVRVILNQQLVSVKIKEETKQGT